MKVFLSFLFVLTILLAAPSYSQDTINVPGDYSAIQDAIDAANNGDVVLVANGTYTENINFKGKAITVASHFLLAGDSTHIENTIIDGSQPSDPDSASVVSFVSGEDTTSVICGFTLTGGTGTLSLIDGDKSGGGVYTYYSGAKICNNIIENNSITHTSYTNGGGIVADLNGLSLIIENNVIRNNTITGDDWSAGGGIAVYDFTYAGYASIVNNKVINNTATDAFTSSGGGIEINGGSDDFFIIGNYIRGNQCGGGDSYGGGLDLYNGTHTAKNNLIVGNSAHNGGGLFIDAVTSTSRSKLNNNRSQNDRQFNHSKILLTASIENNTIVNNSATVSGGGVGKTSIAPGLKNFIIWGNTAPSDPHISGNSYVSYSDVEGGWTGTGNIDVDPQFIAGDYYFALEGTSQCIDAGNPDPMYNDVEDPLSPGNPWWPAQGTLINDMGHCGGPASTWGFRDWPMPVESSSLSVSEFALMHNYPNPFNPSTTIRYEIKELIDVELKVFDLLGREIATLVNEEKPAGSYEVEFDASHLTSGVYFYSLQAGSPSTSSGQSFVETKKMILLK